MNTTTPRALSRTWAATVTYQECGVIVERVTYTVTLTRTAQGIEATVNGEPRELRAALNILQGADVTVTAETLDAPTGPALGRARAARLHRLMGRLGLPSAQHYALAAAALGEWAPLPSLAALTEREARTVWAHLCSLYPQARTLSAA